MKMTLLILLSVLLFSGCSTNEEKAQKLVRKFLQENIEYTQKCVDYDYYFEEESWGKLESVKSSLDKCNAYQNYVKSIESLEKLINYWNDRKEQGSEGERKLTLYDERIEQGMCRLELLRRYKNHYETQYTDGFDGWCIIHSYRFSDDTGEMQSARAVFFVDKSFTEAFPFN